MRWCLNPRSSIFIALLIEIVAYVGTGKKGLIALRVPGSKLAKKLFPHKEVALWHVAVGASVVSLEATIMGVLVCRR